MSLPKCSEEQSTPLQQAWEHLSKHQIEILAKGLGVSTRTLYRWVENPDSMRPIYGPIIEESLPKIMNL